MEIKIDNNSLDQRFDRFCRKWFKNYPEIKLGDIYHRIRIGEIKVNTKKAKEEYRLKEADVIYFDDEKILGGKKFNPEGKHKKQEVSASKLDKIKSLIVYEDENWIVWDKPYGIVIHGGNKHYLDLSMNDYLDAYVGKKLGTDSFKPAFAYRLDKDTSGILIAAKNYEALKYINEIIRDRKIDKNYIAIVEGSFPKHILINKNLKKTFNDKFERGQMKISRDGVEAISECWNIYNTNHPLLGNISLVKVKIKTGRMHQIRIHLASEGFPVVGDIIYGNPVINRIIYKKMKINRQLLHCFNYNFKDINSNKVLQFTSSFPSDFEKTIGFIPKNI